MLKAGRDPLGHETRSPTTTSALLPTEVTDPAGLMTQASYDYRVLQPREVTDPNGNRTRFTFTPLGLLASTRHHGQAGRERGRYTRRLRAYG